MATKYLHQGLGSGSNDGSSAANAWQSTATALANVTAGDEVLSYDGGTGDTLAASLQLSINGSIYSRTKFTGVNASFVDDGTRYLIDGNSAAVNCIDTNGQAGYIFKNFNFTGATGDGVTGTGNYHTFINCRSYSNGANGFDAVPMLYVELYKCQAYSNTSYGFLGQDHNFYSFCLAHGNGVMGFRTTSSNNSCYRCLSYNNTGEGFYMDLATTLIGCLSDDNGNDGFTLVDDQSRLVSCLSTNNTGYGVGGIKAAFIAQVGFIGNSVGEVEGTLYPIYGETNTTISSDPYDNQAGRDYKIDSATADIIGATRDMDGTNISYESCGLVPAVGAAGGVLFNNGLNGGLNG